ARRLGLPGLLPPRTAAHELLRGLGARRRRPPLRPEGRLTAPSPAPPDRAGPVVRPAGPGPVRPAARPHRTTDAPSGTTAPRPPPRGPGARGRGGGGRRAPHPGAAPHGVKVQAGSNGQGGDGARHPTR